MTVMNTPPRKDEIIAQFMLAELNRLEARRETVNQLVNQRFQFYLTITAAAIVLIAGDDFTNFTTTTASTGLLQATAFGVLLALLCIGLMIFARAVKADVEKKRLTEGVRWIKQFFIKEMGASNASPYLFLPAHEEKPLRTKDRLTSLPAPIAVVNSGIASTLAVLALQVISRVFEDPAYRLMGTILPLVILVISFMAHLLYMHWRYDKGDENLNKKRDELKQLRHSTSTGKSQPPTPDS